MKKPILFTLLLMFVPILSYGQTGDSLMLKHGDYLWDDSTSKAIFVLYIPWRNKVFTIGESKDYYKVAYKDTSGWVLKSILMKEADYWEEQKSIAKAKEEKLKSDQKAEEEKLKADQKAEAKAKAIRLKAQQDAIAKRKASLSTKFGSENAEKIIAKKIWLGMTDAMARESLGKPSDINRSVGSWGVNEQWVYGNTYLYFENGVLTSWQD